MINADYIKKKNGEKQLTVLDMCQIFMFIFECFTYSVYIFYQYL